MVWGVQDACTRVPAFCILVSRLTLIPYYMFICCLQVRSCVYLVYWEDLLPGHRGSLEEQGPGGRDACIPPFKTLSMEVRSLHHKGIMRDIYQPKMLLFALDKLFYIYDQIKKQRRPDEKIVVAYEILCLSVNQCTE